VLGETMIQLVPCQSSMRAGQVPWSGVNSTEVSHRRRLREEPTLAPNPPALRHQTWAKTRSKGRGTRLRSSASTSKGADRIFRPPRVPKNRRSWPSIGRPCHAGCL
jgi:hypothetical protein